MIGFFYVLFDFIYLNLIESNRIKKIKMKNKIEQNQIFEI